MSIKKFNDWKDKPSNKKVETEKEEEVKLDKDSLELDQQIELLKKLNS